MKNKYQVLLDSNISLNKTAKQNIAISFIVFKTLLKPKSINFN